MKKVGEILIMAGLGVGVLWGALMLIGLMHEWLTSVISAF
jgi:hypothetical protein